MIVADIDNFKAVNDEHGHQIGDAVLVDVAYTLRKELRAFDIAYRLGGEEFLVLLPGATLEDAELLAERLRVAVAAYPRGRPARDDVLRRGELARGRARDCRGPVRPGRRRALRGQGRRAQPRRHAGRRRRRLAQRRGQRAARGAPAEDAAAEERALQRAVAVHPAAAEAGDLARGVQPGQRLAGVG